MLPNVEGKKWLCVSSMAPNLSDFSVLVLTESLVIAENRQNFVEVHLVVLVASLI